MFVTPELEGAALDVVLLDVDVLEEDAVVELEEPLFVDLFSSEGGGVELGVSSVSS